MKPRPEINSFQLLGQVLFENDAPAEFQNVAFSSEDGPRWRKAEAGMYLIKDGAGRIHAVKHEQLAGPSQSKLRQSHFRCRPTEKQTGNSVIREITPEALKREAPATIEH